MHKRYTKDTLKIHFADISCCFVKQNGPDWFVKAMLLSCERYAFGLQKVCF